MTARARPSRRGGADPEPGVTESGPAAAVCGPAPFSAACRPVSGDVADKVILPRFLGALCCRRDPEGPEVTGSACLVRPFFWPNGPYYQPPYLFFLAWPLSYDGHPAALSSALMRGTVICYDDATAAIVTA